MALEIRKLESKGESEKKRKRNTFILSVVMISILLFSTAGYFSMREDTSSANGEKRVENIGDSWVLKYGDQTMTLSNSPESAANVSIFMLKNLQSFYGKTVYVASDSDAGYYEIDSSLGRYTERLQPACYGKCNKNYPEKDCNNTMIIIRALNESVSEIELGKGKVYEQDNCVFIEGGLSAVDAFLYRIFEVI